MHEYLVEIEWLNEGQVYGRDEHDPGRQRR